MRKQTNAAFERETRKIKYYDYLHMDNALRANQIILQYHISGHCNHV
jgi:hypothetical protein